MNPPSKKGKWMKKAYEQSQKGATVVCLVPSRTDTNGILHKGIISLLKGD